MSQLQTHRYRVVDVFTQQPLEGNALAVFPEAASIPEQQMPLIARELNLSETVFILPATRPGCAAQVRIFTPAHELIFAGHPTVGSAFVLLEEGAVPAGQHHFSLEEKVGPVPVRVEQGEGSRPLIWLRTPAISWGAEFDPAICADALGLSRDELLPVPPQLVSAGNPTIFVPLRSAEAVDRAFLEMQGLRQIKGQNQDDSACVFVFAPTPDGAYSRMFAPELGIVEDPATGSSTGPLAAYMMRHGMIANHPGTRFVSQQGTKMGRRSFLHVQIVEEGGIEVGGYVTPVLEGRMLL